MSPHAPRKTGKELIKILLRHGFEVSRIRGSHHFLKHRDGRATVVPVHRGETVGPGLFARIIKDTDLGIDDFRK